jgi:hypothetical protein
MLLQLDMRAIIPPSLMQTHPQRIVGAKDGRPEWERLLEPLSSSPEQQVDDDQRKNQTDAATATIAVATNGPIPGICLSHWQARSEEAICSTSAFIETICCSRSLPPVPEKADEVAHAWRQVRVSVLEDLGHRHRWSINSFVRD